MTRLMNDLGGPLPRQRVPLAGSRTLGVGAPPLAPQSALAPAADTAALRKSADDYANQQFNQWYGSQNPADLEQFHPSNATPSSFHVVDSARQAGRFVNSGGAKGYTVAGAGGGSPNVTVDQHSDNDPDQQAAVQRANARAHFTKNVLSQDAQYKTMQAAIVNAGRPATVRSTVPLKPMEQIAQDRADEAQRHNLATEQQHAGEFAAQTAGKVGKYVGDKIAAGIGGVKDLAKTYMQGSAKTEAAQTSAEARAAAKVPTKLQLFHAWAGSVGRNATSEQIETKAKEIGLDLGATLTPATQSTPPTPAPAPPPAASSFPVKGTVLGKGSKGQNMVADGNGKTIDSLDGRAYDTFLPANTPAANYTHTATAADGRKVGYNAQTQQWEPLK